MKGYGIHVRVTSITTLPNTYWGFSRYLIKGKSAAGFNWTFKTTSVPKDGRSYQVLTNQEVGSVMEVLFHRTQNGNDIADDWGTGSRWGRDFETPFEHDRAVHLATKEKQLLLEQIAVPPVASTNSKNVRL